MLLLLLSSLLPPIDTVSELTTTSIIPPTSIPVITTPMLLHMTKRYYELHDNNKKMFGAMVTGVVDPDDPEGRIISFDRESYLLYDNKKKLSVANNYLCQKITC